MRIETDLKVKGAPSGSSEGEGSLNGIGGVKGRINLPKKWFAPYYLDAGTGQAKLTYQFMGGVGYQFEKVSTIMGYRYLKWTFDHDDNFGRALKEQILQGPYAGIVVRF